MIESVKVHYYYYYFFPVFTLSPFFPFAFIIELGGAIEGGWIIELIKSTLFSLFWSI